MSHQKDQTRSVVGSMTALVTPFRGGAVDVSALDRLVDEQIAGGTDWLVPCGTTGETPTLTVRERDSVLTSVVKRSNGRCGIMCGAGSNSTADTIERCRAVIGNGAEALMLVAPYYNRPTQEGLFQHFARVADVVEQPIVLYNVPARTGVTISVDTIVRLRKTYGHIVGVKDATGQVDNVSEVLSQCDITVLSGDDNLTWAMMCLGAKGSVSVLSNLCPALAKSVVDAALTGRLELGLARHRKLFDLAMGIGKYGPNPLPIKTALAIKGWINEEFRLPLCPLDGQSRTAIESVLRRHELLNPAA